MLKYRNAKIDDIKLSLDKIKQYEETEITERQREIEKSNQSS